MTISKVKKHRPRHNGRDWPTCGGTPRSRTVIHNMARPHCRRLKSAPNLSPYSLRRISNMDGYCLEDKDLHLSARSPVRFCATAAVRLRRRRGIAHDQQHTSYSDHYLARARLHHLRNRTRRHPAQCDGQLRRHLYLHAHCWNCSRGRNAEPVCFLRAL